MMFCYPKIPLPNDGDMYRLTSDELGKLIRSAYESGVEDCKNNLSTITVSTGDANYDFMNEYCSSCKVKFCDPHKKHCLENCVKYYKYSGKAI